MANTEKPTTKAETKRQQTAGTSKKTNTENLEKQPKKEASKKETEKASVKSAKDTQKQETDKKPEEETETAKKESSEESNETETGKEESGKKETEKASVKSAKDTQKQETDKKPEEETETAKKAAKKQTTKPLVKKDEAVVNGLSLPISAKDAVAVCRFIKYKGIERAIEELEEVVKLRRHIPIKGEIPHRKGPGKRGSGSGRFPVKAAKNFLKLLTSLKANAENNGIETPVIAIAFANIASRPVGKFGRVRKKRSHVKIIAKEKNKLKQNKKK